MGKMSRFGPTSRGGLVGFAFFLCVAAAALGGCGDSASSPLEEGEQGRGLEEVVEPEPAEPRGEPKPPEEAEAEPAKERPEAPPPPAPKQEPPAAPVAEEADADGDGVDSEAAAPVPAPPVGDFTANRR